MPSRAPTPTPCLFAPHPSPPLCGKQVRSYTGLGLKEAKELVESAPATIRSDVPKEEAEQLKEKLEGVGGTVNLD